MITESLAICKNDYPSYGTVNSDKLAGRRCVALLPEFFTRAGPPGLAVHLRDLDADHRAQTVTEFLWYYVTSLNPWMIVQEYIVLNEAGLRQVTFTVRERELRLCGDMLRGFLQRNLRLNAVLSESGCWTVPNGRPLASRLRDVDSFLKDRVWRAWRLPAPWPE